MNNRFIKILALASSSALFLSGCGSSSNSAFQSGASGTDANSGTISQKNFSILTADVAPAVIDISTGIFTKTDVELTVFIGDRNNQTLTDSHTINFVAEYGLVEPNCVTKDGSCSVTWSAIKRPDPGGPGDDGRVTITAFTTGEEGFTDTNGNGVYDDGDAAFDDLDEPFVDANEDNVFNVGDTIIDVKSSGDSTGKNQVHDFADGFFNGGGCKHSSLCSSNKSITIFDSVSMSLVSGTASRTIGGTVTGLLGVDLILQNNGGDDLPITVNGNYTFATPVEDGMTYNVTVLSEPNTPNQTCTVVNKTGSVSANVTNVNVTCSTNTFTIAGNVTGLPGGETLTLQNNGGDNLVINANGAFIFATPIADGATYNVTVLTDPATATCTPSGGTGAGTVSNADVTNVTIGCI
ncbi:MAG TPA: hypothetical protein ENJ87_05055 [Gammaproteobacteria bacterium]|nr:hypothetical protein [Gammaproteobacteria bacterium]